MAKQDLTKKQREASEKRRQVLSSYAFQEWWSARKHIHPIPSDPYRAFMIDIGLVARIHRKEIWRGRVPRADYPSIDLPSFIPAPKRRLPPSVSGIGTGFRLAPRIERERKAWEFADPFMRQRRQEQKWLKKYALGTYLGTIKPEKVTKEFG